MTDAYFLHVHGAAGSAAALTAAIEQQLLRAGSGEFVAVLHTPIALPGSDPLPVDQDERLLLCQLDGRGATQVAPVIDAAARAIAGVREVSHQRMQGERITPGAPDDPTAPARAVAWFVQYNGPAEDAAAFHVYYRTHHVPIVHRMPGIRALNWYRPTAWTTPGQAHRVDYLQLVQAVFDDIDGLLKMRNSAQRKEGLRDFDNYPKFEGPVTHQAMLSRRLRG